MSMAKLSDIQALDEQEKTDFLELLGSVPVPGIMSVMDHEKAELIAGMADGRDMTLEQTGSLVMFNPNLVLRDSGRHLVSFVEGRSFKELLVPCTLRKDKTKWSNIVEVYAG